MPHGIKPRKMRPFGKKRGPDVEYYRERDDNDYYDQEVANNETEKYEVIDWSESLLYKYYIENQNYLNIDKFQQIGYDYEFGRLCWNQRYFTNWEVDELLEAIKGNYDAYVAQKVHGPLYLKALLTLKHLYEEQCVDYQKLLRLRQ